MKRLLALCLLLAAATPAAGGPSLCLEHATILDARGNGWLENRSLVVEQGRIVTIAPTGTIAPPADATRVDLAGHYLVPSLIDLHSHLLLHPYDETSWDDQVLREALEHRTLRASVAARRTLDAGWTTLRDLGTEGARAGQA